MPLGSGILTLKTKRLQEEALFNKTPLWEGILTNNLSFDLWSLLRSFYWYWVPVRSEIISRGELLPPLSWHTLFFRALWPFLLPFDFYPFGFYFLPFSFVGDFRQGHPLPMCSFASLNDTRTEGVAPILTRSRMYANTHSEEIYFIIHRECVQNSFLKEPRLT